MSKVIIIGAGGHARVIADIIKANGNELVGFLDDDISKKPLDTISNAEKYSDCEFIIGIGNNVTRAKIASEHPSLKWHTAIHPSVIIGSNVEIGQGTVIMPGAVINCDTKIGQHVIINTHATIEHDNQISDFVHISPGATLCGTVTVGDYSWVCAGATVINNINIAQNTILGAGSVVVSSINGPNQTHIGIPARRLK